MFLNYEDFLLESEDPDKLRLVHKFKEELERRDLGYVSPHKTDQSAKRGVYQFKFTWDVSRHLIDRALKTYNIGITNPSKTSKITSGDDYRVEFDGGELHVKRAGSKDSARTYYCPISPSYEEEQDKDKAINDCIDFIEENAINYIAKIAVELGAVEIPLSSKGKPLNPDIIEKYVEVDFGKTLPDFAKDEPEFWKAISANLSFIVYLAQTKGWGKLKIIPNTKNFRILTNGKECDGNFSLNVRSSPTNKTITTDVKWESWRHSGKLAKDIDSADKIVHRQLKKDPNQLPEIFHKMRGVIKGRSFGV